MRAFDRSPRLHGRKGGAVVQGSEKEKGGACDEYVHSLTNKRQVTDAEQDAREGDRGHKQYDGTR
jgi:hypothetical protein